MTVKDYEMIALSLAQAKAEAYNKDSRKGSDSCIEHICHALQIADKRFNPQKFRTYVNRIARSL